MFNQKKHFTENIEAIRVMFELEKSGMPASNDELEILKRYRGFGGIKCIILDEKDKWSQTDRALLPFIEKLKTLLYTQLGNDKEYIRYWNSLKESVLTAFYTPKEYSDVIIDSIYDTGLPVTRIIDPSAGHGEFINSSIKLSPNDIESMELTAFEKDFLTGKILYHLHRDANINIQGFEEISQDQLGHFDLISSNIPFGNMTTYDPLFQFSKDKDRVHATRSIHNYFSVKGMDVIREGGLMAFIVSSSLLDSPTNAFIRKHLVTQANLISSIRLPHNAFSEYANTKVGTDLIVLQKNSFKTELSKKELQFINTQISIDKTYYNSLYSSLNNIIFSSGFLGKDLYGKKCLIYEEEGGIPVIASKLKNLLHQEIGMYIDPDLYYKYIPEHTHSSNILISSQSINPPKQDPLTLFDLYDIQTLEIEKNVTVTPTRKQERKKTKSDDNGMRDLFSLPPVENPVSQDYSVRPFYDQILSFYKQGTLVINQGQIGYLKNSLSEKFDFHPLKINYSTCEKIEAYIQIRDIYQNLYYYEARYNEANTDLREKLNETYDTFVKRYGDLNTPKNIKYILMDALCRDTLALEYFENGIKKKADIFYNPVSFVEHELVHTDSAGEALAICLNRLGKVDLNYLYELTDKDADTLLHELQGLVFYNPINGEYEIRNKLLSGDIIEKIERIEAYLCTHEDDSLSQDTLQTLLAAKPVQINFEELDLNFGERWIPCDVFGKYISEIFDTQVNIHLIADVDQFIINCSSTNAIINQKYAVTTQHNRLDGLKLLRHALYNTTPIIHKKINEGTQEIEVTDNDATQLALLKIDEIRNGFRPWLESQPEDLRKSLVKQYNKLFCNSTRVEWDGSFQTFPGLDLKALGIKELYKSQKDCVWMLISLGGGIVHHEVGLGKTLIMAIASQEMKRLKLAHKPLLLALPNNIDQVVDTCKLAYPKAKILYTTKKEFTPKGRIELFNKIKNNNWDLVILSHDQFAKIPQSLDIQKEIIEEELENVRLNLEVLRSKGISISKKLENGMIKRQKNLFAKLATISQKINTKKDDFIDFGMLGIDHIFVDESQQFKNLEFDTRHKRVAGLGNCSGSQRALNLLYAIRSIQGKKQSDLCATFASGTIISNALSELFTLHRYMRPQALKKQNIYNIDAWLATYAIKSSDFEFSVTNEIISKERFRHYIKVPELTQFHFEITDYRTAADTNIDRPRAIETLCTTELTSQQKIFAQKLIMFAQTGNGELLGRDTLSHEELTAKMLIATTYARKMATDMRLIDSILYTDEAGNKLSICAKNISAVYHEYNEQKGTQFVFCDLGTYKSHEWNVYSELKRKLVQDYNLPANEIRFAQEFTTEKERYKMKQAVNNGEIRIIMGSTVLLGTGGNMQERAVAAHHLDTPWMPKDFIQRNGRLVRTGNTVAKLFADNEVQILIYATKNSLDIYKFTLLKNKQLFIDQICSGNCTCRRIDEGAIDMENGCSFAEYVAALSGNTDLLEKSKIEKKIAVLENERSAFYRHQAHHKYSLHYLEKQLELTSEKNQKQTSDWEKYNSNIQHDKNGNVMNNIKFTSLETTDLKKIANYLLEMNKSKTIFDHKKIGSLLGFDIKVNTEINEKNSFHKFYIESQYVYTHNNGHLASTPQLALGSFIKALDVIPRILKKTEDEKEKLLKDLNTMQIEIKRSWGKDEQLKELKNTLSELERKIQYTLNLANRTSPAIPTIGENEGSAKKVQHNLSRYLDQEDKTTYNKNTSKHIPKRASKH